jgi:hypothetical protein
MTDDLYATDEARGESWHLMLGDSCERLAELADESVDLSICSPPFDSLFTYSPTMRDLGNSATREQFLDHYGYVIREQLRVTKPGRVACVHVQQVATKKSVVGHVGLTDFRGDVIRAFQAAGWIFYGEVTVWKDPQAQSIRTKAYALAFQTKNRDSAGTRPALADYLLIFRKPGQNAVPIPHHKTRGEVTNDDWIEWASPIWFDRSEGGDVGGDHLAPVWVGIRETETLTARAVRAPVLQPRRDGADAVRRHRFRGLRRASAWPPRHRNRAETELLAAVRHQLATPGRRAQHPFHVR